MAITAETRKSIVQLVVTAYNAAPGTTLLTELVAASTGGASLADIATTLSTSSTFNSIYPTFQTSTEFATEFLGNLVPEASAEAVAEGVAVIEGVLNGGGTRADVIMQASSFLAALSETDASFGSSAANFNNKVEVAEHHTITLELDSANITDLQNVLSTVTSDDATVEPAKTNAASSGGQQGETITLTTGADAITGSAADDLIVATEATLSSADVLDGGAGTDTLRYASSGAAAVNESGFESKNIEIMSVTSDAVGGTTFDLSGVAGATTVRNFNSSQNLTVSGLSAVTDVTLDNVGSPDNSVTPNTTVNYNAAATIGTNTQNVSLISNSNANGGTIGTLTANGIENFSVTTSGGASGLAGIASTSLDTLTVMGDQNLTITGMLVGADTVSAGSFTGNLSVVLDSAGTAKDVAVTGGTGNDRADFSAGFEKGDSFDGGEGTDTLGVLNAVATGTPAGTLTNVEILDITDAATGTVDMDNFAGVTKVILNAGIAASATSTIDDAVSGIEVEVDSANLGSDNLVVDLKTDGTADEITVTIDRVTGAHSIASINAADAETLNISVDDDSTANTTASFTITSLTASDATTINLSGDATTVITNTVDPTTPALTKLDASAMTGKLTVSGTNFSKAGATIMLGSGDDTINFATSSGADTITLGDGKDTLAYTAAAQSDGDMDTVTDFVSGTDKLSLATLGGNPLLTFVGNKASFGQAQGSLPGSGTPASGLSAVYQIDDEILWVDTDDNGTLDNNDFRIKLTGVTALTAADVGLSSSGNTATLTAAAATVNATTKTNATNTTTNFADTISSTIAFLAGSTIDGGLGTDTLALSDAGAVGALAATITNVETLTLATKSSTANTGVAFNDAGVFANVTGSSNADTIASTADLRESGTISLGDGNDTITALALLETSGGADTGVKVTVDMGAGNDAVTTTTLVTWTASTVLNGGAGTDTLTLAAASNTSAGTISGFETINTGATATMSNAQINGATTLTNGGNLTVSDAATITTDANILGAGDTLTLGNFTNTITLGAGTGASTLTGGTGADSITATDTIAAAMTAITGGTGTDTLTITAFDSATNISANATGIENIVLQGTGTGSTLTLAAGVGTTSVDASALTAAGTTIVTGALATAFTITGSNFADTINNATAAAAMTAHLNNGDSVAAHIAAQADKFNITASATGSTAVTIANADGAAAQDTLILKNSAGTQVNVAGFIVNTTNFTGGGVVSAKATDDGTNTVLQVDMDGNGVFGANDIQVTLTGVSDGSAGDGQALFAITAGQLTIL